MITRKDLLKSGRRLSPRALPMCVKHRGPTLCIPTNHVDLDTVCLLLEGEQS